MEILPGLIDSAAILRERGTTDAIHREFRAGRLVRIRRGFYVQTADWLRARPSERFAWSTAAITRSVKGALLCGETAALASGLPTLRTPPCVEPATTLPGRSGVRRSPLMVVGEDSAAQQARGVRSYPLRYCLKPDVEPVAYGEYHCTSRIRTTVDVMVTASFTEALVVADGLARILSREGRLPSDAGLLAIQAIADGIAAHPYASARRRAERVAVLASPLAESVGESYSRAAFDLLGFEQPVLQHAFHDGEGLSAGQIAGGPSSGWWGNSTERPSMSRPLSGARPQQRKPCTGKSSARIGSGGWASALCAGAGPIWKTPADLNVGCSQPGCALGSEASSQIGTLKAMICQQAWEWSAPAHGRGIPTNVNAEFNISVACVLAPPGVLWFTM